MKSVYVGNLPYATTDNELKALFESFGTVHSARIKTDRETGRPLGYGFVLMEDADADKAIAALNGKEHAGRNLRVNESREKSSGSDRPPRRDFGPGRPSGAGERAGFDRPPRRDFGAGRPSGAGERAGFDRPPRRDFGAGRPSGSGERPRFDRPPRRDMNSGFVPDQSVSEDYDMDSEDSDYTSSSQDFGGNERQQRRRTFRKSNSYNRDNRDVDRPRRPFFKSSPRKKGYRPNEDYESEE